MASSKRWIGLGFLALVLIAPLGLLRAYPQEKSADKAPGVGAPLTLWNGKDHFGWDSPAGSGLNAFGQGGNWIHRTTFGPSTLTIQIAPNEIAGELVVLIVGKGPGLTAERTLNITPGSKGYTETIDVGNESYRVGVRIKDLPVTSIKLTPKQMKPLFNGKDLEGWSVFPGKKTDFTWNPNGFLSVKNGPGDIQTKDSFDHFVAQVDIKTNGKHLNSGIFFKALPGQYWKGYEAQIRNQFNERADQKYTLEVYDPKTHQLVSKVGVDSKAVDYGTGAIYRRIPTRVQASKDGEWFTMTIAVHGRHIATWVNGVQTVDWMDNRPDNDNPREGYRTLPGVFSIQGHDPTTDIDFKNFQVISLKP